MEMHRQRSRNLHIEREGRENQEPPASPSFRMMNLANGPTCGCLFSVKKLPGKSSKPNTKSRNVEKGVCEDTRGSSASRFFTHHL